MNKQLEANTNLSHYRILQKIGVGGIGKFFGGSHKTLAGDGAQISH